MADYERGVQEETERIQKVIDGATPIAERIVEDMKEINPVEGSDFSYMPELDAESKADLVEFLVSEVVSGGFDLNNSADVEDLKELAVQEIWATDGRRISEAYGKKMFEKGQEETEKKYENWQPLKEEKPATGEPAKQTDEDRARSIIGY